MSSEATPSRRGHAMRKSLTTLLLILSVSGADTLQGQWVQTSLPSFNVSSLAVSGTNIFAGTNSGVFLSTDNGTTWALVDSGFNTYFSVSALAARGTNVVAGTSNYGIFFSTNSGASWKEVRDSGQTLYGTVCLAMTGSYLFAGLDAGLYRSSDNGTTWDRLNLGIAGLYVSALAFSGTYLFAGTGNGGGVLLSTDNGTSWTAINSGFPSYSSTIYADVYALAVADTNLFVGTLGGVYRSSTTSLNWTPSNFGLSPTVLSFASSSTSLFAGTSNNGVFLSTNSGTSWAVVNSGFTNTYFGVPALAVSGANVFAGIYNGVWGRPISDAIASIVPPIIYISQTSIAFGSVHTDSTKTDTLRITDSSANPLIINSVYTGTSWFAVASVRDTVTIADPMSLPVSFTPNTAKAYSDTLYILSNASVPLMKVLLSGNGTLTAVSQNESGIPKSYGISQNYPNPFNPSTVIDYQLPMNSFVTLKVYDILGRQVATLVEGKQDAGYHHATFDAANLPSGVYFDRLEAGTYHETKKLLLLK